MSNIEKYPKCHMRTLLGNCDPIGGFCTSVKTDICEALHKAAKPKTWTCRYCTYWDDLDYDAPRQGWCCQFEEWTDADEFCSRYEM